MQGIIFSFKEKFVDSDYTEFDKVRKMLSQNGFQWAQGNLYVNTEGLDGYRYVYQVMNQLKTNTWFCDKVRDIKVLRISDWTDFTEELIKK